MFLKLFIEKADIFIAHFVGYFGNDIGGVSKQLTGTGHFLLLDQLLEP